MPKAANEIVIERPVGDVFAFLADAENDIKWRQGVVEIKRVSGNGATGTRYRQRVKGPGGRAVSADVEITDYRPDELIGFRATSGPVRPSGRYLVTAVDVGTRVRFELEAELRGLKRLLSPMVEKTMRSEVSALTDLKRALEAARGEGR